MNREALSQLSLETLDWRFKAISPDAYGLSVAAWLQHGPRLRDLATPLVALDAQALADNISGMASYCESAGLKHAPHGKTTMAPQLWQRQLDAGAWAITVANWPQLRVAHQFSVPRVIVANELVTPTALRWLSQWVASGAKVVCFVDSIAAVAAMNRALTGGDAPIEVCVELGGPGGRAGARQVSTAEQVCSAVRDAQNLRLVGVSGYEGSVAHDDSPQDIDKVDEFLWRIRQLYEASSFETDEPIVSAGGSAYFDQVVDVLGPLAAAGVNVVLRSGSYVSHDDGMYESMTPAARGRSGPTFSSAIRAYGTVLAKPEPGLAILDVGRRDVSFDAGYPVPLDFPDIRVRALNDQHAHLYGDVSPIAVGDVMRLGISHPCTTFDKWNLIPVVDSEGVIIEAVRTFF